MQNLLKEFSLQFLLPELEEAGIEYTHLQYLNERDIADAIKKIGPRAEFREKLFEWRNNTLQKEMDNTNRNSFSDKSLSKLLSSTDAGINIKQFYAKNEFLTSEHRDKLINIILENVFLNGKKLVPSDFKVLIDEINKEFPQEKYVSDYYYYARSGKKAPGGKLFHRYHNYKAKHRKVETKILVETTLEKIDDDIKLLKQELLWPLQSWEAVCDRWSRTYILRQEDIKSLDNISFLQEWPIIKDSRAIDLINIDFNIAFPGKNNNLCEKWPKFKEDIIKYYSTKQLNQNCRDLLKIALESGNKDFQDGTLLNLLNAVLLPIGFGGKSYTILQAQNFFILSINSINNIEVKIEQLRENCRTLENTLQPFVIVEGMLTAQNFYTYFDKTFLKFTSFLEAFDCVFKLFFVLNLKYPDPCIKAWTFVQKYFYEIDTSHDIRSASLSSFLNHMLKSSTQKTILTD